MSVLSVQKTRIANGTWEGLVTDVPSGVTPGVEVRLRDEKIEAVRIQPLGNGDWSLTFPIPQDLISEGIQTLTIHEANTGDLLDSVAIIAGDMANATQQAEIDLLRAELDMLKRAFRRHCVET
ncbi:hypothetical protein ACRARG_09870 [Pseudooceanicola sp. C21-150M6]|uniref:hypothetical protein n=1 Tax=Pseudooceanicola sp. C21-150M6 TaxID=3434355 RepID=UPI003D7F761C